ncbi:MAG: DUF4019 domain-containing protein [Marinobacterium sp.]|nr:DUF4019 domain-containing protein [Marinobacterium sp.]
MIHFSIYQRLTVLGLNLLIIIAVSLLTINLATANEQSPEERIARNWLQLVDHGDYIHSWERADKSFQRRINQQDWLNVVDYARSPLGKPISRQLAKLTDDPDLSNEHERYVHLDFYTRFEHRLTATERITLHKQEQHWRITRYLIH